MGGNVAARLDWPSNAPATGLAQAVVGAVESSGFDCEIKPLGAWHLGLIKADGAKLALTRDSPTLAEQLLEPAAASASSGAPPTTSEEAQEAQGPPEKRRRTA